MDILVVGSVAFDTVETPFGLRHEVLGGSATYFSTAASFFAGVRLVAVVGEDFPVEHREFLQSRNIDLAGLQEAAEAVRELRPSALRGWLIGRFANAGSLVMMRDLSASKWRYVFLLLLIDRRRDALRLVWRALWPERDWLIARYGRYTLTTRLRHLFDAARGKI